MMGDCNCACMPVQKALWPFISPFFEHFLCCFFSFSVVSILPLISSQVFSLIRPFWLLWFRSLCVVFTVFVFSFCISEPTRFYVPLPAIITVSFLSLWFICVWGLWFFFQSDAALLLDSRSANANAEWNDKCLYSQCSCHLVYSGPLLKAMRPHWGLIRFQGDCRRPLKGAIYSAVWINNIITTLTSYLLLLSGRSKLRLCSNGGGQWLDWSSPACFAAVTFNQTIIYYSKSRPHTHTHIKSAEVVFSSMCRINGDSQIWRPTSRMKIGACRIPWFPAPKALRHLRLLRKHRSFIGARYTSAQGVFEEGSRFHRDSTSDVLFIEVEEIRRFSLPLLSSKWEIFVSLRACWSPGD